jgi:hypothetical protein
MICLWAFWIAGIPGIFKFPTLHAIANIASWFSICEIQPNASDYSNHHVAILRTIIHKAECLMGLCTLASRSNTGLALRQQYTTQLIWKGPCASGPNHDTAAANNVQVSFVMASSELRIWTAAKSLIYIRMSFANEESIRSQSCTVRWHLNRDIAANGSTSLDESYVLTYNPR